MNRAFIAVGLLLTMSNIAAAQGSEVHSRLGADGSCLTLSQDTKTFDYEATVSGTTLGYVATLEVYHNGILKSVQAQVGAPLSTLAFKAQVDMASWGLKAGDSVTFRLKVASIGLGQLLGSHTLTAEVGPAPTPQTH